MWATMDEVPTMVSGPALLGVIFEVIYAENRVERGFSS